MLKMAGCSSGIRVKLTPKICIYKELETKQTNKIRAKSVNQQSWDLNSHTFAHQGGFTTRTHKKNETIKDLFRKSK